MKGRRRVLGPWTVVFLGALVAAIGGWWSALRQEGLRTEAAEQRVKFEQELRVKSDEIAELNRKIAASVTGGDGFCYLLLNGYGEGDGGTLIVSNEGTILCMM